MPLAWIYSGRVTNEELAEAHKEMKELDGIRVKLNREYCAKLGPSHFEALAQAALVLNQMGKK